MASHPTKIGKYDVEGIIGRGGMGVVYKAVDAQIGRYVAIKMILSGGDESLLERFRSEARSTGALQCPNIVTVYDLGEQDGNPYLVMQYLQGSSLESLLQKKESLSLAERLGILIDVCNGLAYAHQRGIIHRDIKPANIVVLEDGVNDGMGVIVDFGIARIGGSTRLTKTDQVIGSVHYMSPEQLQAKNLDSRTDIYSTGVVLFQLLTGELPFQSPETAATLLKILNEPPPPLNAYLSEYPAELDAIVSRVLAKNRDERYATARDLALDLKQVQEHLKSDSVAQLVKKAEVALAREDWARAREHLQQALRIDRQNTRAEKLLNSVQEVLRQQQKLEQARTLRSQADEAYLEQRFDDALHLLDQAIALDPGNTDLKSLLISVREASERAASLRKVLSRAESALNEGDLDEAQHALSEAFTIDPQDTQAKALKLVISRHAERKLLQNRVRKLLDEARTQIAARDLARAFATLATVQALDPTSSELQNVARLAVAAREQENRRVKTQELHRQIEAALQREDYVTAVAKADEGLSRFPSDESLTRLKALAEEQRQRAEQKKFVSEQFTAANTLAEADNPREALALLERALRRAPGNHELESLRTSLSGRVAAEDARQGKRQTLAANLEQAKRVLEQRGAPAALQYLDGYAAEFSDFPEYRDFRERLQERAALDALNARLALERDPESKAMVAAEALHSHPSNRWIRERLEQVNEERTRVNKGIERAKSLEQAQHIPEALHQWRKLAGAYPQSPKFASEVRRIEILQAAQISGAAKPVSPSPDFPVLDPPELERASANLSATVVLGSAAPSTASERQATSGAARVGATSRAETNVARAAPILPSGSTATIRTQPKTATYLVVATAVVVLSVAGYLIFGGANKMATVTIATEPPGADVAIGTEHCHAPCTVKLAPGKYELHAEHGGYQPSTAEVSITADTRQLPVMILSALLQPAISTGVEEVAGGPDHGATGTTNTLTVRHESAALGRADTKRQQTLAGGQNPLGGIVKQTEPTSSTAANAAQVEKFPPTQPQAQPQPPASPPSGTTLVATNTQPEAGKGIGGAASAPPSRADAVPINPTASDISSQDQNDIQALLGSYADAVARKDTKSIQGLWPGVPKEKLKSFKQAFETNTRLSFSDWHFFKEDNDRVRVSCVQKVQASLDGKQSSFDKPFTLYVRRKGARWQIDYIPLND